MKRLVLNSIMRFFFNMPSEVESAPMAAGGLKNHAHSVRLLG